MAPTPPRIHCELGPVLVNRTAVYKMCRMTPRELARRGFAVRCSALLAKLSAEDASPSSRLQQWLYSFSRNWLLAACARPGLCKRMRGVSGPCLAWRHGQGIRLFLDPLFFLFYNGPDQSVVLVHDLTTVTDPEWHPRGVSSLYRCAFQMLARSNCRIVTPSQNSADQLRASFGIAPSRLSVIPEGLFPQGAAPHAGAVAAPFLLFVGSFEPRKNVPGLIRAFDRSRLFSDRGIRLRVIGHIPEEDHPAIRLARETPGVDLCGFVSEAELKAAYQQCFAFVYPSFCEGFGLPLLEAMHHGCVCLATETGASPEVGGDAALYVNPYSVEDIARGMRQIATMPERVRELLTGQAHERAALFRWSRFYDALAEVLRAQVVEESAAPARKRASALACAADS